MLVVSTSTAYLASADSLISPLSITSATDAATSTVISSSVFESAGSSSSQATFSSSDTAPIPHSTNSEAPLNSAVSSSGRVFTSSLHSSSREPSVAGSAAAINPSASLDTRSSIAEIKSSQTTVASDTTTSPFIETALQTSLSDSSSFDSSQIKVLASVSTTSNNAPSDTSTTTSSPTTFVSEKRPITTHDFMSPSSGTTSHTASSYSSSINQTSSSSRTSTPSASSPATSDFSPHRTHSYLSKDTGGDITPTITSLDTGSSMRAQSPISGAATATSSGSSQSLQGTYVLPQPSNVITSSPILHTPSHPEMRQSEGNDRLTSPTHIPVHPTTVLACQNSSSAALESKLSTYDPLVRLRNTVQDGGYGIYTATFTSFKTLYKLTTITASPISATMTTSTPYTTKTEDIPTTLTVAAQATTSVVTATIVVPTSKAGGAFRYVFL
ncbi:hypothetical protein DFS33DRAFT_635609 [Desarmillaria ectypa]|nr:hypothetical protein DFS33DRAFT_635609 [Desarmillaria ectypa]